jgi:starch synthase (maltosyl-transferring)
MRPNFFVNTPDILSEYLQYSGPAGFEVRAVLAATMSPTWGVYSGYELYEHEPVRAGSEEYLDSEKYQYRPRDWQGAQTSGATMAPLITKLNAIRRAHPALQTLRGIWFHATDSDDVICYSKRDGDEPDADLIIVVVNLNPHRPRETTIHLDMSALNLAEDAVFVAHDLLSDTTWRWSAHQYVRLDPTVQVAHLVSVRPLP